MTIVKKFGDYSAQLGATCHPYRLNTPNAKFVIIPRGPTEAKNSIRVDVNDLKRDVKFALK